MPEFQIWSRGMPGNETSVYNRVSGFSCLDGLNARGVGNWASLVAPTEERLRKDKVHHAVGAYRGQKGLQGYIAQKKGPTP